MKYTLTEQQIFAKSCISDVYTLNFSVNTEPIKAKAPHINLAIQAIACGAPEQRYWEAIHAGTVKTKID